jgi:hypothetical protein
MITYKRRREYTWKMLHCRSACDLAVAAHRLAAQFCDCEMEWNWTELNWRTDENGARPTNACRWPAAMMAWQWRVQIYSRPAAAPALGVCMQCMLSLVSIDRPLALAAPDDDAPAAAAFLTFPSLVDPSPSLSREYVQTPRAQLLRPAAHIPALVLFAHAVTHAHARNK